MGKYTDKILLPSPKAAFPVILSTFVTEIGKFSAEFLPLRNHKNYEYLLKYRILAQNHISDLADVYL